LRCHLATDLLDAPSIPKSFGASGELLHHT
jgi:hypothetical protein